MLCASCGRVNPGDAAFCGSCGSNLRNLPQQPVAPPTTSVPPTTPISSPTPASNWSAQLDVGLPDTTQTVQPTVTVPPPYVAPPYVAPNVTAQMPQSPYPVGTATTYPANPNTRVYRETFFDAVGNRVGAVTGVGGLEGFNAQEMFSGVMEKHSEDDIEEYFTAGTRTTTPRLEQILPIWPKPWIFFRVFTISLLVYFAFYFGLRNFNNPNLIPGLIIVGSFAVPFSMVIFYYEMNVARNVSLYQTLKMVFLGGVLSLIATLFIDSLVAPQQMTAWTIPLVAGTTEEIGKLLALAIVANRVQYRWTLNGLLLGGAVGAGFAGFETAGYALNALFRGIQQQEGLSPLFSTILFRGILSPGGHVAWAAITGAALWRVKGNRPFSFSMLQDTSFLRVLGLAMALHFTWDTPILAEGVLGYIKLAALIGIALIAVLGFVQDGLKQIQAAQVINATMGENT